MGIISAYLVGRCRICFQPLDEHAGWRSVTDPRCPPKVEAKK